MANLTHDLLLKVIAATPVGQRTHAQKQRLAAVLANPGLRTKVPDSLLTPAQRAQRQQNTMLNAPVVPGSSVTYRDLVHQRQAATTLRYGGDESQLNQNLQAAQTAVPMVGGWYDAYQKELAQHQQNIKDTNDAAVRQQEALTGAVGAIQAPPSAPPVPGATPSAQNATDSANAQAVRQALAATFGAAMAQQGASANTYADSLTNVVGPAQKLEAVTGMQGEVGKARQALADLQKEKGAFGQQFEDQFKQDEAKNVLAAQIAGDKNTIEAGKLTLAQQIAGTKADQNSPAGKGAAAAATGEANAASKYGYTVHQWRLLGPNGRARVIAASKKTPTKPGSDVITSGPLAGKTKAWVEAHPDEAGKLVSDYEARHNGPGGKPKDPAAAAFKDKYGVPLLSVKDHNSARSDIASAGQWLNRLVGPGKSTGQAGQLLTTGQPAGKNSDGTPRPAVPSFDPVLIRAAMDIKQYGGIRPGTADRLHRAGYSVGTLRLKMAPAATPAVTATIPGLGPITAPPFGANPPTP